MTRVNKKYNDIVVSAKKLFWKFGFRRVTVEEICQQAHVSKMTFYKHFANKTELAIEIIRRMFDESMKDYNEMMNSDIPFDKKMQLQLKMKLEGTADISEEFVKDVYGNAGSEIHQYWEKRANEAIAGVIEQFRTAQEKGWLRRDMKIEFILYMINQFFEFAKDDALISRYDTMQDLIMEINRFFLFGILPRDQEPDE
jgi:AcrR family transcriptional regulator